MYTRMRYPVRWLKRYPNLLRKLQETVDVRLKVVHIVRNPFDNISTMTIKDYASIQDAMDSYFDNCKAIVYIYKLIDPADLLIARHEELIEAPEDFLKKMCAFLGVDASEEYLRDAGGIIFKSPSKTRSKLEWREQEIAAVHENIKHFDFLDGYSFDV